MQSLFSLPFFTTPWGLSAIGLTAALILILWDWRWATAGLILTQWGVGNLLVQRFNMPVEWATAFLFVAGLSSIMLAMSAIQVRWNRRVPAAGNVVMRLLIILLAYFLFTTQAIRLPLPLIDAETIGFFSWLSLIALIMLMVGDSPLHTGISMALWLIVVQAITAILLPNPSLIVVVGSIQMVLMLAISYLILPASNAKPDNRPLAHFLPGPNRSTETPASAPMATVTPGGSEHA